MRDQRTRERELSARRVVLSVNSVERAQCRTIGELTERRERGDLHSRLGVTRVRDERRLRVRRRQLRPVR